MIIWQGNQHLDDGSANPEWLAARRGIPTASRFSDILSSSGKASASASRYMNELIAEQLAGKRLDDRTNEWMQRGTDMEGDAREAYEFVEQVEVRQVGLVYRTKAKDVAASPDGLIADDGGVEIKCPKASTHVGYMLEAKQQKCPAKYYPQVMGSMWVTGRKWWDFVSYHPDLPLAVVRVERDAKWCEKLAVAIKEFNAAMQEKLRLLAA